MSDKTLVTFVLDRSGSMGMIIDSTLEAFNAYVDGLKGDADIDFTLVQFDTEGIDKVHFEKPINDVPSLTRETYKPRGGTPLIDAAYSTIEALEKAVERKREAGQEPKVVVCIQTDGEENSSKNRTWSELKELIGRKQAEGWQFNFMGAGIDAYQQARMMGLSDGQTMSYDSADLGATRAAFSATAMNSMAYARGTMSSTSYSVGQKAAAGDKFDPGAGGAVQAPPKSRSPWELDLTEKKDGVSL